MKLSTVKSIWNNLRNYTVDISPNVTGKILIYNFKLDIKFIVKLVQTNIGNLSDCEKPLLERKNTGQKSKTKTKAGHSLLFPEFKKEYFLLFLGKPGNYLFPGISVMFLS